MANVSLHCHALIGCRHGNEVSQLPVGGAFTPPKTKKKLKTTRKTQINRAIAVVEHGPVRHSTGNCLVRGSFFSSIFLDGAV